MDRRTFLALTGNEDFLDLSKRHQFAIEIFAYM